MTSVSHVHHTGLTVSDLERSVGFYCGMLGCHVVSRQEKAGGYLAKIVGSPSAHVRMVHLRAPHGELIIELFEYVKPGSVVQPLEPWRIGNAHLAFVVDDLAAVYSKLRAQGVEFVSEPVDIDTGVNAGGKGLYLRDPDGITLELFELPPGRG